jgi:hypothetical protein
MFGAERRQAPGRENMPDDPAPDGARLLLFNQQRRSALVAESTTALVFIFEIS